MFIIFFFNNDWFQKFAFASPFLFIWSLFGVYYDGKNTMTERIQWFNKSDAKSNKYDAIVGLIQWFKSDAQLQIQNTCTQNKFKAKTHH